MRSRIFSLEEVLHEAIEVYGQSDSGGAEAGGGRDGGAGSVPRARDQYGGMDVSLMTRMKELEEENRRLKKLYIEAQIKADIVAEALAKKV